MTILAIDPGSEQSGLVVYDEARHEVRHAAKVENGELRHRLYAWSTVADVAVIEWTAPRGMPASSQLFETLWWAGRFAEVLLALDLPVERLLRSEVKRRLCGTTAAKDTNVTAALVDRFGGVGGRRAAVGVKAAPGPLYGVRSDAWAALAVAVAWSDSRP